MIKLYAFRHGFTLIEMVAVILLLGILAAIAVPQFIDFSSDARKSVVEQTAGTISSAIKMVNMKAQVEGVAGEANVTISIEGSSIQLNYGYPSTSSNSGLFESVDIGDVGFYGKQSDNTRHDWVIQYIGRSQRSGIDIGVGVLSKDGTSEEGMMPETTRCYIRYFIATATLPAEVIKTTDGC